MKRDLNGFMKPRSNSGLYLSTEEGRYCIIIIESFTFLSSSDDSRRYPMEITKNTASTREERFRKKLEKISKGQIYTADNWKRTNSMHILSL